MTENRLSDLPEQPTKKSKKKVDDKIWAIAYKERKRFAYITSKELQELLEIDRVKITGKYEEIEFDGLKKKVWVDGEIKLSEAERKKQEELQKPKDFLDKDENDEHGLLS